MDFIPLSTKKPGGKKKIIPKRFSPSKGSFFRDKKLISRITQYMLVNQHKHYINIDEMAESLQCEYREYTRKKRNSFKIAVEQAYNHILKNDEQFRSKNDDWKNQDQDKERSESEFSSDNENYVQVEDTNLVNSTLHSLYSRNADKKRSASSTDIKESDSLNDSKKRKVNEIKQKKKDGSSNEDKKPVKLKSASFAETSTVTFADIAGCEKITLDVCQHILIPFKYSKVFETLGVDPPIGILLHGPPGCGKTLFAYAIAGELGVPFFKLGATELVSGVSGESEEKIRDLFTRAIACAPCVIFIDEIDAITQKRQTAQREMDKRIVTQLQTCLDELTKTNSPKQVLVIGATNLPDSLDPALRRAGRFDREILFGIPDEKARLKILILLCKRLRLHSDCNLEWVAHNTPGYVGADLKSLIREATMCAAVKSIFNISGQNENFHSLKRNIDEEIEEAIARLHEEKEITEEHLESLYIKKDDFTAALKIVQPSSKREGFATIPDVKWDDVGALKDIRSELELSILAPVRHQQLFERFTLETPAGILLYGPPGCGKTLLAKAIANEIGVNFISVKGPELLNMYVGESERAVRQCFQRAKNSAPCIIFFDEIDSLCQRRSDLGESGYSARILTTLLTEMDGFEMRKGVYILAATNRPDIIDRCILRPGRLEKVYFVGIPTVQDRIDILRTISKKDTIPLADDVDLVAIAEDQRCERFTGADLNALLRAAKMCAIREILANEGAEEKVFLKHFEMAFQNTHPSVSQKDQEMYERMKQSFAS